MEITKYTEYRTTISSGTVTTQIPEEEEAPVQIILNTGRQLIMSLEEWGEITNAVTEALSAAGRIEKIEEPGP